MEIELLERLVAIPKFPESRKSEIYELADRYHKETSPSTSMFDDRRQCLNANFEELRETARRELASTSTKLTTVPNGFASSKGSIQDSDENNGGQISREPTPTPGIPYPSVADYNTVPKYMSRPLPLSDLHIMIGALETAVKEQKKLVGIKFNALPKNKKDVVIRLRDEARDLKVQLTSPFVSEADWKAHMDTRLQAKLKWASQILRQLKIIKEMRLKSKVFYLVTM